MQNISDEYGLAEVLIDAACRGSGMSNAALLRPVDANGGIEVIAASKPLITGGQYSRSLINSASGGVIAAFSPHSEEAAPHSLVMMKIEAALCVPLMLGTAVAGYLYIDARQDSADLSANDWAAASGFCAALGRIGSLALANLKRVDVERPRCPGRGRNTSRRPGVTVGHAAPRVSACDLSMRGESRPGRVVGGDFFDFIPLDDGQLAVAVGDVAGKGLGASVLITVVQGFLHAALQQSPPEIAVERLGRFLAARKPCDRFLTLWVGVLDPVPPHAQLYRCRPWICLSDAARWYASDVWTAAMISPLARRIPSAARLSPLPWLIMASCWWSVTGSSNKPAPASINMKRARPLGSPAFARMYGKSCT